MGTTIAFVLGLVLGTMFGVLVTAVLVVGDDDGRQ